MGNTCPLSAKNTATVEPLEILDVPMRNICNVIKDANGGCILTIKDMTKPNRLVRVNTISKPCMETSQSVDSWTDPEKHIRILLLGTSDSGKTTLGRQIRMLYGEPFGAREMLHFKQLIRESCLKDLSDCAIQYMSFLTSESSWQRECNDFLLKLQNKEDVGNLMDISVSIWGNTEFQKYLLSLNLPMNNQTTDDDRFFGYSFDAALSSYQSDDPAYHLIPKLDVIMSAGYEPSLDDILSLRITTTGIVETLLKKPPLTISLIDVGGQRSERKKWLHCFENISAVLFMVAMSEYDQRLKEDGDANRMKESIKLFSTIFHNTWFRNSSLLLFLNKKDVFDQKIKYSPLSSCFQEYKGENLKKMPEDYLAEQFLSELNIDRGIYRHFTCAKDRKNISVVFDVTIDLIKHRNLQYCGMF